jgi:hypothetical protein
MSAAVPSNSPPVKLNYEPFGQTGIRQYIGSTLAFLSAAMMAASIALWFRSRDTADILDVYHPYGRVVISSTWGRLRVAAFPGQGESEWTWFYNMRPFRQQGEDPWKPSLWKTIGIEARAQPADNRFPSGWWMRMKWSTATLLFGVWPLMHALRQTSLVRAARRVRAEIAESSRYCGRCGRPLGADARRCAHCGREFA